MSVCVRFIFHSLYREMRNYFQQRNILVCLVSRGQDCLFPVIIWTIIVQQPSFQNWLIGNITSLLSWREERTYSGRRLTVSIAALWVSDTFQFCRIRSLDSAVVENCIVQSHMHIEFQFPFSLETNLLVLLCNIFQFKNWNNLIDIFLNCNTIIFGDGAVDYEIERR